MRADSTAARCEHRTKGSSSAAACRKGRRALHEPCRVCTAGLQNVISAHSELSFVSPAISFWKSNDQFLYIFPFGGINDAASGNALLSSVTLGRQILASECCTKIFSVLSLAVLCFQMCTEKLMEFSHVDKGAADTRLPSLTNNACFKKHCLPLSGN